MSEQCFPELGYYTLPGHTLSPKAISEEVVSGDDLGLGSVWISERYGTKDIGVLSGIAAALSSNMGIASGLIGNLPLRNPLVVASYAATMASITDNRFSLGIGRAVDIIADITGTPRGTFKVLEEYIDVLRQLWRGEVVDYDGPGGKLSKYAMPTSLEISPPIIMGVMGDKTAAWAGKHCDGVVYNSLWSGEAIAHSTAIVRKSAEEAGRNPEDIRVWTIQVTACETSEEDFLNYVIRRMNTYVLFPPMFKTICEKNGWDPAIADKIRAALQEIDGNKGKGGVGDEHTTRELDALKRIRDLYPDEWIYRGNAVGDAKSCAVETAARFDAGADGVLFHGSPPNKLAPLLRVWPDYRPTDRFTKRSVNPGL